MLIYIKKIGIFSKHHSECLHQQVLVCCSLVDNNNIQNKCVRIMSVFETFLKFQINYFIIR